GGGGGGGEGEGGAGGGAGGDRQGVGGRRHAGGGDRASGGGADDQAGGHRPRYVVEQPDGGRPGQVPRAGETDLDPLPGGAERAGLGPGGGGVAVEGARGIALRHFPEPRARRGGGDAGRAGEHSDGLAAGGPRGQPPAGPPAAR